MRIRTSKTYIIEGRIIKEGSILEVTEESELLEMAKKWKEIQDDLKDELYVREEHLIKLYHYKGQPKYKEDFSRWVDSAKKGFQISKWEKTNKYPPTTMIYNEIWTKVEDSFDDYHISLIEDLNNEYKYYEKITDAKLDEVREFVQKYNEWASELLSKKGNVNKTEAVNKIEELLDL